MNKTRLLLGCVYGVASLGMSAHALAQTPVTFRYVCTGSGYNAPEPLGDREGHSIQVGQFVCRAEGGPLDGGVMTGTMIWDYDKTNAVALSGNGVIRKPGATSSYAVLDSKIALTLTDGKVTGYTGDGRGRFTLATGSAGSLNGKAYGFTFKSTGPGLFVVDVKVD